MIIDQFLFYERTSLNIILIKNVEFSFRYLLYMFKTSQATFV